jgi:hypothetical protein
LSHNVVAMLPLSAFEPWPLQTSYLQPKNLLKNEREYPRDICVSSRYSGQVFPEWANLSSAVLILVNGALQMLPGANSEINFQIVKDHSYRAIRTGCWENLAKKTDRPSFTTFASETSGQLHIQGLCFYSGFIRDHCL